MFVYLYTLLSFDIYLSFTAVKRHLAQLCTSHDCLKKVVCQTELLSYELSSTRHQSSHKLHKTNTSMISKSVYPGFVEHGHTNAHTRFSKHS